MQTPMQPHSFEAEEGLIGSVIIQPESWAEVRSMVSAQDFFRERNQLIWAAFERLSDELPDGTPYVNPIKAMAVLKEGVLMDYFRQQYPKLHLEEYADKLREFFKQIADYFIYLIGQTPTAVHAKYYAEVVRDLAMMRRGYKPLVEKQKKEGNKGFEGIV